MQALESLEALLLDSKCSPQDLCAKFSEIFGVQTHEVGLLHVDDQLLRFLYPVELQAVGTIPLSGPSIAARTAVSKQAQTFNKFSQVPHTNVFEKIKLQALPKDTTTPPPIQKLMSAPIVDEDGAVLGVVQISRKGISPGSAGPDFSDQDLELLQRIARRVAVVMPEIRSTKFDLRDRKLRFQSA